MAKKGCLVAIGTEITTGEIINTNAAWMANALVSAGAEVEFHLAVDDAESRIHKALVFAAQNSDLIFVCGGLGPTTDDLTRKAVADFLGKELYFDQVAYDYCVKVRTALGRKMNDSHRWQCQFPTGSVLLENPEGTALGFVCDWQGKKIFVLPGPPKELQGMWQKGVAPILKSMNLAPDWHLFAWTLRGTGESDVAEKTEKIFAGSGFKLGYRASMPNIFVKVWVPTEKLGSQQSLFDRFEKDLQPFIHSRGMSS